MLESGHGIVLGRGWIYYASVVLPAAVGWPVLVAGLAGTLALVFTRFRQSAVILAFPIAYYVVAGKGYGVFALYIRPVVPFLCLAAAGLTVYAVRRATMRAAPAVRRLALVAATLAMMAPTAYKSALLDRLLTTEDNRIVTARALIKTIPPGSFFYQTGETYGHVPSRVGERRLQVRVVRYQQGSDRFTPVEPDWILVQRSPLLLYSSVPDALERRLAEEYVSVRRFPAEREVAVGRTYDQQDAFYIPLDGLEALERPGPSFELYARAEPKAAQRSPR
jgi:hypothetical protein